MDGACLKAVAAHSPEAGLGGCDRHAGAGRRTHDRECSRCLKVSADLLPFSLVIPTRDRPAILQRMLASVAAQSKQPAEIIIIDASDTAPARPLPPVPALLGRVVWLPALTVGAAPQRNQGVAA